MDFLKDKLIFLREILQDFYQLELKNRLPKPEPWEVALIRQFKTGLGQLSITPAGPSWTSFSKRLKIYSKFFDPRKFLNWRLIYGTMFMKVLPSEYLQELQNDPQWQAKWLPLAKEDKWGNAVLGDQVAGSSGNILTHIFHLHRLQKATGVDFSKLDLVVEFGGGYGSMCRLIRRLGFKGTYVLYDLPEFLYLQEFYLKGLGFKTSRYGQVGFHESGVNLLASSIEDLQKSLKSMRNGESLFIATWSVSETPIETRREVLGLVNDFNYFLFGFQPKFDQIDNNEYFGQLVKARGSVDWKMEELIPWSGYYLFGKNNIKINHV